MRRTPTIRITLIVVALAIPTSILLFWLLNRPVAVKAYFRFETAWTDHWPFRTGKWGLQHLMPVLTRNGILTPVRVRVEPHASFLLDPRDLVSVTILRTGSWQPEIWQSLSSSLAPGSVFLDVGAHIGYFSIKAAPQVGPAGRVVAFEPNPETLKLLRDNVAVNNAPNVVIEPIACTEREQTLQFYAAPTINTGASSLSQQNANVSSGESPRAYTVRGRPIDDVVRDLKLSRVDAIKIDVEGAEVSVLRGALQTLTRFHPKIVIEVIASQLASFQTTPEDVTALIKSAGYNVGRPLNPETADWEWTRQDPNSLKSSIRMADPSSATQLIRGFHALEQNAWRWTDGSFSVNVRTPDGANEKGARLMLAFYVPEVSLKELKTMTLSMSVEGQALAPETFSIAGKHELNREAPASSLRKPLTHLEFSLDKFLKTNGVENGIIVTSVGLQIR